jgi:predicted metal-dependent HD superfamily phosphohydrolase
MDNVMEYVKGKWKVLTAFSKKQEIKDQLWNEIVYHYSAQHRHYHNLNHIAHLFSLLDEHIDRVKNPAIMGFAILYHDIVYDTYRQDNEEQSALLVEAHLKQLSVNPNLIKNVQAFIAATKDHRVPEDIAFASDLALLLDFDMAILATEAEMYKLYSDKIRQEYSKYPDELYKEGRKLALQQVLASPQIFTTSTFRESMEVKARENIENEVSLL